MNNFTDLVLNVKFVCQFLGVTVFFFGCCLLVCFCYSLDAEIAVQSFVCFIFYFFVVLLSWLFLLSFIFCITVLCRSPEYVILKHQGGEELGRGPGKPTTTSRLMHAFPDGEQVSTPVPNLTNRVDKSR